MSRRRQLTTVEGLGLRKSNRILHRHQLPDRSRPPLRALKLAFAPEAKARRGESLGCLLRSPAIPSAIPDRTHSLVSPYPRGRLVRYPPLGLLPCLRERSP